MSGYIVQICVSHDPIKPKAWLAASSDDAASVVYDRTCARVFETAEEAHSAAVQYRKSKRALTTDFLVRQKRRAAYARRIFRHGLRSESHSAPGKRARPSFPTIFAAGSLHLAWTRFRMVA